MEIAFDGQLFLKGEQKTGIAWNAHNLILELAKYPENQCTIQCFHSRNMERLDTYRKAGCRVVCCRRFGHTAYKLLWLVIPVPHRFFFRAKPDIVQFFNYTVPPGVYGKRVVFIYDMAYRSCPHTVSRKVWLWLKMSMKKSCRHADHIVTVSAFSKREILKYLQVPQDRVSVIPSAVDHQIYHMGYTNRQIQRVLDKYGICREYFLYLGTIEPRKNLERLIGAYERLCRERTHVPLLVLAGARGWLCEGIYKKARTSTVRDQILFLGYVKQEESPVLMCGAKAFVFPSLYEGFGMPPLEAMACGTPVIASNAAALPEVVKDAGILADPMSEEEICRAMRMILDDETVVQRYRMLGLQRAGEYTWERSASMLMKVYRDLCMEKKTEVWKVQE